MKLPYKNGYKERIKRKGLTDEHKRKISEAKTGKKIKPHTEEHKRKIGEFQKGELNHNWKGGIACEPYCPSWLDKEYKEEIKEYYSYKCQNPLCLCDSSDIVLHHIDYVKKNCHWKNIIPVCRSSNGKANKDRWLWTEIYQRVIERNT